MALIKNSDELRKLYRYNLCGGERPTIADSIRASHDTPYNEGVNVGKDLVTIFHDDSDSPRECYPGPYGGYIPCRIVNPYLGLIHAQIYADRVVLGIDYYYNRDLGIGGVTLTRVAAVNFLCGVMDGMDGAVEFLNITKVKLYAAKDIATGGVACVKFSIGEVNSDQERDRENDVPFCPVSYW